MFSVSKFTYLFISMKINISSSLTQKAPFSRPCWPSRKRTRWTPVGRSAQVCKCSQIPYRRSRLHRHVRGERAQCSVSLWNNFASTGPKWHIIIYISRPIHVPKSDWIFLSGKIKPKIQKRLKWDEINFSLSSFSPTFTTGKRAMKVMKLCWFSACTVKKYLQEIVAFAGIISCRSARNADNPDN